MARSKLNSKGVEVVAGNGAAIDYDSTNAGFTPFPQASATAITASGALTGAGVFTISGSAVLTVTLPAAASSVGMLATFRCASVHAHILSASAEAGTNICSTTAHGSKLTLASPVGSAATLLCDGVSWQILAASGTYTLAL